MKIWFKQITRRTMNYEWIAKTIWKKENPIQKIEKTVKIEVKLPHKNKKPLARKRTFVQTSFSHSTLKLERIHFTPQNQLLFHFLFWCDQNYSNVTSKIIKMCEQTRP